MAKICIVTQKEISMNPRVTKEADALVQAGYDVRVIFSSGNTESLREYNDSVLQNVHWKWKAVKWSSMVPEERNLYWKTRFRHNIFKRLPPFLSRFKDFAELGEGRLYKELSQIAAEEKADLYIGHYPIGLAAAAYAASKWNAKLGYDVEDLHAEEYQIRRNQKKRIGMIENRYLHRCSYITAVTGFIADEIAKRYNIKKPLVIYNVFPWEERARIDEKIKDRKGSALSLYWYSAFVGENRGIQDAIKAAALLEGKVQIHIRGQAKKNTIKNLLAAARNSNMEDKIFFHPFAFPGELLSRANEHDVGLALERPQSVNRSLTVSNKLFFYLSAGLAVAATDTPGQRSIMDSCPNAGFLYKPGDFKTLAYRLNEFIHSPEKLQRCKQASLEWARKRWNWEEENKKLIGNIRNILA